MNMATTIRMCQESKSPGFDLLSSIYCDIIKLKGRTWPFLIIGDLVKLSVVFDLRLLCRLLFLILKIWHQKCFKLRSFWIPNIYHHILVPNLKSEMFQSLNLRIKFWILKHFHFSIDMSTSIFFLLGSWVYIYIYIYILHCILLRNCDCI